MLLARPIVFRKRRAKARAASEQRPPVAPLTLVGASYDPGGPTLTMTFDRAVNVDAFNGSQVVVNDPVSMSARYDGTGGVAVTGAATVDVTLVATDLPSGTTVTMDATGLTGIVADDDGGAWAGVTGLELPFP